MKDAARILADHLAAIGDCHPVCEVRRDDRPEAERTRARS